MAFTGVTARFTNLLLVLCGAATLSHAAGPLANSEAATGQTLVYIGSYAPKDEEGIHICQLDMETGTLTRIAGVKGIKSPSFQALHPNKQVLYSVSESQDFRGTRTGSVSAFAIDKNTGTLEFLNEQSSLGAAPCHLITDLDGKNVIVANYSSGNLAVLPVKSDGSLDIARNPVQHSGSSVHPARQKGPHAHCVNSDSLGRFIVSADLGLDKVLIYRFNGADRSLTPNSRMPAAEVAPGSGPRHFAFHPNGKFGYVINELNSTVTAFAYDSTQGTLTKFQNISTLPAHFGGRNSTAEIFVSPDGRFLYGSNRGHNSIVVFSIEPETGKLVHVSHHASLGEQPRNFGIDPTGSFLLVANQQAGNVVVFRINRATGKLGATGHTLDLYKPVCVTFLQR